MKVHDYISKKRHWHFTKVTRPEGIHFAITSGNLKQVSEHLCDDLREACDYVI